MSIQTNERLQKFTRAWIVPVFVAVLLATSFKSAIADWNDVPSGSMLPTIWIGDRIFVNKLAYGLKIPYTTVHLWRWSQPQRGEIAVFYSPQDGKRLVKRIVGVPGDTIALQRNRLYINGQAVPYEHVGEFRDDRESPKAGLKFIQFREALPGRQHRMMITQGGLALNTFGPVQIPAGHFFMMGDNRDNSKDSRFFGLVKEDQIVGRASAVVLSRNGNLLHPRWQRMFKELI